MAISARIIEVMGGRMWLESSPGSGTTFHFTMQAAVASNGACGLAAPKWSDTFVEEDAIAETVLDILVAEDNAVNQKLIRAMLERMGHHVTVAANGREAVKTLCAGRYDTIFMDVQMPEIEGFDATRAVRTAEKGTGAHVPIVAMTAHAMDQDRKRCLESGMDAYISKPISRAAVFERLLAVQRSAGSRTASIINPVAAAKDAGGTVERSTPASLL